MRRALIALVAVGCVPTTTTPVTPTGTTGPGSTTTPQLVEDTFLQQLAPRVDLLYVVQDTDGMADAQAALVENAPFTFDYLLGSGIDYHVGVVSTDLDDPSESGKLLEAGGLKWIDSDTPSPLEVFSGLVWAAGASGTQAVQARGATFLALEVERDLANAGFYRSDASLTVAVVGEGGDQTDPTLIDPAAFATWFPGLKADPADARWSCVLTSGVPLSDCADTAATVGGQVIEEQDPALAGELLGLGASRLSQSWPLSRVPDPSTIEVEVEDVSGAMLPFSDDDWTFDATSNTVAFVEYVPNALSTVIVRYQPL